MSGSMKCAVKRFLVATVCAFALSACAGSHASKSSADSSAIPDRPDKLGAGEVHFDLPKVDRWVLKNGLVVYYRYDDELPKMSGALYLRGGSYFEPAELAGLSSAVGSELRDGSIQGVSPEELDRTLDRMAATVETSFGEEEGMLTFSCLAEDFDKVFGISSKIIQEPQFNEARFELWRKLALDGIKRRRDDPVTMAAIAFNEFLYGKGTPFSRLASEESLKRIRREDMKKYAARFLRPNGAILAVSGALKEEEFKSFVEKYFGSWTGPSDPLPPYPKVENKVVPAVYVLEREFQQTYVMMGHLGPPRLTPDVYEMNIYNRILGGGFGSLLFDEIRTQLGLAYDVEGGIHPGAVAGSVQMALSSRNEMALKAAATAYSILEGTLKNNPEQSQFDDAKSAVEQSFAFRFASPSAIVQRAAQQEFYKFPADYDSTYLERIHRVTPEMVVGVGNRWIRPKEEVIVIVGGVSAEKAAEIFHPLGWKVFRMTFDTEPKVGEEVR